MNTPIENRADVQPSNPVKLLTKSNPDFTTKSKPLATIFISTNAVLTGVAGYLARIKFRPLDVIFVFTLQICIVKFWGML